MPLAPLDLASIGTDLKRLTDLLRRARMQLPGAAARAFATERDEILLAFDGYLEPRIGAPDAPIVAAIVGPGGVGKSTLLNSIARETISPTGVVRPTTKYPVVWADESHPDDMWSEFSERVSHHLGGRVDAVLVENPMTEHLTIIDTPPFDHQDTGSFADEAVAISDICIFVTTPTRYADGKAWDFLRRIRRRGIPILFVLNRLSTHPVEQEAVLLDLAVRLHQRELLAQPDPSLLFGLAEGDVGDAATDSDNGTISGIRKELTEVGDEVYRQGLVDETVYATARMVAERARALTRPLAAEQPIVEMLLSSVASAYDAEARILEAELAAGEVHPGPSTMPWREVAASVAGLVTRRAGAAAQRAATLWSSRAEAAELVGVDGPDLWRHGDTTPNATLLALESWRSGLEALATTHSRSGRLRWGSGPRTVEALWRATLSATDELPRRVKRKFADGGREVLAIARAEMGEAIRAGLAHDAARYSRFVGSDDVEDLYSAIIDQADIVDGRLDALASQIPGSWSESVDDVEVLVPQHEQVVSITIDDGSAVIELGADEREHSSEVMIHSDAAPEPGS